MAKEPRAFVYEEGFAMFQAWLTGLESKIGRKVKVITFRNLLNRIGFLPIRELVGIPQIPRDMEWGRSFWLRFLKISNKRMSNLYWEYPEYGVAIAIRMGEYVKAISGRTSGER